MTSIFFYFFPKPIFLSQKVFSKRHPACKYCLSYKYAKHIFVAKYIVFQLPSIVISGILYYSVINRLRKGSRRNSRKTQLSVAFFALWVSWAVLSLPYSFYDLYKTFISKFYRFDMEVGITGALSRHHSSLCLFCSNQINTNFIILKFWQAEFDHNTVWHLYFRSFSSSFYCVHQNLLSELVSEIIAKLLLETMFLMTSFGANIHTLSLQFFSQFSQILVQLRNNTSKGSKKMRLKKRVY